MKYILKKIITLIITLLIVSMLSFLVFEIIPGDPARTILGTEATESKVEALRKEMGLDDKVHMRYGRWISGIVKGDFGESYSYRTPVSEMIGSKLPITLTLTLFAFLFILLLALPFGVMSARYANTWIDRILFVGNQIIMSVPSFFIGIVFTVVFGLVLKWFMPGGYVSYTKSVSGFVTYLILPALAIAIPKAAMAGKMLRSAMIEELGKDYVRTAYSRGNTARQVLLKHVLRNGIIPVITFLGWAIADILANSIIVEQVFGIPGIGRILISSIASRDYPVVEAIIVMVATVVLVVNVVVDMIYHKVDKRVEIL